MLTFLMVIADEVVRDQMEQVYLTYHEILYKVSFDILKDHYEAEDMVQEAIINFSRYSEKIDDINCKKTKGLIVTIVRNLSYNAYKKQNKVIRIDHEEVATILDDEDYLVEKQLIRFERSREIAGLLSRIKESYADIISLRYYYELTTEEIATLLGMEEGNVYARLSRARTALKKLLQKEGISVE